MKRFSYVIFALIILLTSWETNKSQAAIVQLDIPQESIRLRILANSDSLEDQWIKRKVRDAVIAQMNEWVAEPQGIEEARETLRSRLPEMRQVIGEVLQQYRYTYVYDADLDIVPFPTKMYGDRVYPAGDYEALRITLGEGKGLNWWCVLFPPLCFVDIFAGEGIAKDPIQSDTLSESKDNEEQAPLKTATDKEVRFFIWDQLQNVLSAVKSIFA